MGLARFGKGYAGVEHTKRLALFGAKIENVLKHNDEYLAGRTTYFKSLNEFSDWTHDEVAAMLKARVGLARAAHASSHRVAMDQDVPDAFSWKDRKGVLPGPNAQGMCGSCWAFATTKAIESHYAIQNSEPSPLLSPQTFLNCVDNPNECGGTGGCGGATSEMAFNVSVATGVASQKDLPYHAGADGCAPYKPTVTVGSYVRLPTNLEAADLETALYTIGPMVVVVDATNWNDYGGGIFHDGCVNRKFLPISCTLNHAVLAVGFDRTDRKKGYWQISNSWGSSWGERGYIRLSREFDNETYTDKNPADGTACKPYPDNQTVRGESGVLFDVSYPVDVKPAAIITV